MDPLLLTPELGVPYDKGVKYVDLFQRAQAVCNTAAYLGLVVTATEEDEEVATILAKAYAKDPEHTSKEVTTPRASDMTPASLVLVGKTLEEFGRQVVHDAVQIRHMVTNKLVIETEDSDPRIRLRAMELLGKISDVGLFTDKVQITHEHRTSDELRDQLREKLTKHMGKAETVPANPDEAVDAEFSEIRKIDVDAELGVV